MLSTDHLRTKLLAAGLETSSNFVAVLDAHGIIWWCNASFEALTGYTLEEAGGKDIRLFLSERNNPDTIVEAKECIGNQREWRGEIITRRKDGCDYVDGVAITPILDEAGQTSYLLVVGRDITEKVKAREAMLAAQEAQVRAEKMYSIGVMAAGISHEINQPLNAIRVISGGIMYLLAQGEKLQAEEFAESISEIASQTDRITNIIEHLRTFVRRGEIRLTPCDINAAVERGLKVVGKQLADHAVTVQKQLQANIPLVQAVATGLEQVVINLLVNAIQALDTLNKQDKEIRIRTYFSDHVILEISDNGPGVDPALGKTIFESFVSTKSNGDNLGLGLAIVNNMVASFFGTVEVVTNDRAGATFIVSLPAIQDDNKEKAE